YSPQVTIISPHNMKVAESITLAICVALGGRGRLWGAIFGALVVNYSYSSLTSDLSSAWPYIQGAMFIGVVLFLPDGFVGIWTQLERRMTAGASIPRLFMTALPLLTVALFVLTEAVGLVPEVLRHNWGFGLGITRVFKFTLAH